MPYTDQEYRKRRAEKCNELFADFYPDTTGARKPDEVIRIYELAKDGYFSHEIAEIIGKSPKSVQKTFRRYDFPALHNFEPPRLEERPNYINGIKKMKGYLYKRMPHHPNGTKHGNYVAVHRLVMEEKLNRYLKPEEVVHHIDGDIKNNHPDNLEVYPDNATHLSETLSGKVPNWTKQGLKALDRSRRQPRKTWKGKIRKYNH